MDTVRALHVPVSDSPRRSSLGLRAVPLPPGHPAANENPLLEYKRPGPCREAGQTPGVIYAPESPMGSGGSWELALNHTLA